MYAFCQDMPGVSLEDQRRVEAAIPPEALSACVAHVVGAIEGGVRMIDVWTDEASYRRFQTEVLWPTLGRLGPSLVEGGASASAFTTHEVTA